MLMAVTASWLVRAAEAHTSLSGPSLREVPPAAIAADRLSLRDKPVAAAAVHYLDGTWTASTEGDVEAGVPATTINATVPGDIISDLFAAGLIGNPLFENNFKHHSLWTQDWTYTSEFDVPQHWTFEHDPVVRGEVLMVFESVKMGASVSLNGRPVGVLNDQFRRYVFPVTDLKPSANTLSVSFTRDIECEGRWMACTGGW